MMLGQALLLYEMTCCSKVPLSTNDSGAEGNKLGESRSCFCMDSTPTECVDTATEEAGIILRGAVEVDPNPGLRKMRLSESQLQGNVNCTNGTLHLETSVDRTIIARPFS